MDEHDNDLVRLDFFTNIGKAITSSSTLQELYRVVMEHIGSIFAPAHWSLLLRQPKSGDLKFVMVIGSGESALMGKTIESGKGVAGWIAEKGMPLIIEDVQNDSRFDPTMDIENGFITRSIIGVPLKTRTRVFGVIELINKINGTHFSAFELRLLCAIADYAAIAMEKLYYINALKKSAITDPLTGLNNRRLLVPVLKRELDRARREKELFSILFVDINEFKQVNDRFGHDVGDTVLKKVATILKEVFRKSDFICRYGGDEFVIIQSRANLSQAQVAKERVLAHPQYLELVQKYQIGLSVGLREAGNENIADIMSSVDQDMYEEKVRENEENPEDLASVLEETFPLT